MLIDSLNIENMEPDDIGEDVSLWGGGLGLDSIDVLEVIVALERNFNVRLVDEDIENGEMESVSSIANFVLKSCSSEE